MFLPVPVTLCAGQNQPNKCTSYANIFHQVYYYYLFAYGSAPIAYISFFCILKKCLCFKSGPYLTKSVIQIADLDHLGILACLDRLMLFPINIYKMVRYMLIQRHALLLSSMMLRGLLWWCIIITCR